MLPSSQDAVCGDAKPASTSGHLTNRSSGRTWAAGIITAVFLSGCSITPEPLTYDERQAILKEDKGRLASRYTTLSGPVTIYEAMAYTVVGNIEYQVQVMEEMVASGQFDLAKLDLLPRLRARGQGVARDPERASSSESIITRRQSLEPSTSEDKARGLADLTFSWNLLDAGVSYYQAKQEADRTIITAELRRRSLQNLINQIRVSYWRASAAQILKPQIEDVLAQAEEALTSSRKAEELQLVPPIEALRYQRSLLDIIRQMELMRSDMENALVDMRRLMNLAPGAKMVLVPPTATLMDVDVADMDMETLEQLALDQRPEMREEMYRTRISHAETKKALLRLLPGVELRSSANYDSNSFLVNNFWEEVSLEVTGNLVDLFTARTRMAFADSQVELGVQKRLAMQVAIISQVNLSVSQLGLAQSQLGRAEQINDVETKILGLVTINARNDAENELERIRSAAAAVISGQQRYQAMADAQSAFGRMLLALGVDPIPDDADPTNVRALTRAIEAWQTKLERGQLPFPGFGPRVSYLYEHAFPIAYL